MHEMDLCEANAYATALTPPRLCNIARLFGYFGSACCSDGVWGKDGCDLNQYTLGDPDYYGLVTLLRH